MRFHDVTVRYPGAERDAVISASLDVAGGQFVVIVGPSGCGKSTLLRTVNRLVEPHSGRIFVDGRDNATLDATELRRHIGYVIQAVGLFAHMTVAQNIAVVPVLLGWAKPRIEERVDELLTLVHLEPNRYRSRYPRELSGGEAQRVGVARALAARPALLLMDEPFGAVDAIVRASLQKQMKQIAQGVDTTILFVTHDVDEGLKLADRLVIMSEGRIVQDGTPLQILTNPANEFVAQLLDAKDVVRRLQLLHVLDAMRSGTPSPDGEAIDSHATLRESLNMFLRGAQALRVLKDGATVGTLHFEDVQRVIEGQAA
ncbi:MAG: ABC transporter ATP-binding protein [Candidatus Eremiobacteraeota bacterium]|nr:ABC transporter ATP-binding protein [Candidatus Eremiobacteraeota bacterium]MBV9973206.1 ABC transporter ATP-binding protein [Candidatus Eremiobacteraeota bacterium]